MKEGPVDIRARHLPPQPPKVWQFRRYLLHLWERMTPNVVILVLLVIFLLLTFWSRIVYVVQSGERGVLFEMFGGTYIGDSFSEGVHFINPINTFYLYNVRLQEKRDTVVVLSNNGLDIRIQVVYRFRPVLEELPLLHQQIGPAYESVLVTPSVISSIREVIGRYKPEEIYTTHTNIIPGEVFAETRKRVEGRHVVIEAVIIENISLPPSVQSAIVSKHVVEQDLLAYEFRLEMEEKECKRKEIEALGYQRYNELVGSTLNKDLLIWSGVQATFKLASSPNSKLVIAGGGGGAGGGIGLPLILGNQMAFDSAAERPAGVPSTAASVTGTPERGGSGAPATVGVVGAAGASPAAASSAVALPVTSSSGQTAPASPAMRAVDGRPAR